VLTAEAAPAVDVAQPVDALTSRTRAWPLAVVGVAAAAVCVAALYSLAGLDGNVRLFTAGVAGAVAGVSWWRAASRWWPGVDLGSRVSVAWLAVLGLAAVLAGVLPLPEARDPSKTLTSPTLLRPDLLSGHPLGTDRLGLDLLGGVVYGARVSLVVGLGAAAVGLLIGLPIGMLAGFLRGRVETIVDFVTNVMLAFPPIILLLAMVSVVRPSVTNVALVLGVISVPVYVRISKLNTVMYAERDFIPAAVVAGATKRRILARELLPCVLPPVMTYGVLVIAVAIVAESSLSFLGLSIQRPEPTWGNIIAAGRDSYTTNPHLVFVPGAVLVVTVLALNRVNQALRRRSDPQDSKL
jgi:peptide/nickel transport system permease protein